jgi:putative spermidine/putrescine transport system ATP-binding protein
MSGIRKVFGSTVALDDFSLTIESGQLVCLLGPSGCGKTTALRILAGFEQPDRGSVLVDGGDFLNQPVSKRRVGMVFQDYSLFPNMTARENITFGLRIQRKSPAERSATVDHLLALTDLQAHAAKYPHQLSGGQKQRVALARAVATEPRLLLLDEPLSALDAKVREALRDEIRRLQRELGITTLFVTHDQHEALAIADLVGVMSQGRLEQLAPPAELYREPVNAFVAGFVGSMNQVAAQAGPSGTWIVMNRTLHGSRPSRSGEVGLVAVRPEDVTIEAGRGASTVESVAFLGPITRVTIRDSNLGRLLADLISAEARGLAINGPVAVGLRSDVSRVVVLSE